MIATMRTSLQVAVVLFSTMGWAARQPGPGLWALQPRPMTSPAGAASAQPQLSISSRGVLLSWIEQASGRATLKFAEQSGGRWSPAQMVAAGTDWFVNWADVPSVSRLDDGTLVAHWLQKSGAGAAAYDVRLSHSPDNGRTWATPIVPHSDGTLTEHGFASLFPMPGRGGLGLVWLDGRAMTGGHGAHGGGDMSLRFGAFDRQWTQIVEVPVDLRVCDCCPTAAALTSEGPIVAYRDRAADETRDIAVSRLVNGKWTEPAAAHADRWQINACPVNGPALSASGRTVVLAWFTASDDQPKALAAFSNDAGRTFSAPIRLDEGGSTGRVDIELLPDGSAAALYVERSEGRSRLDVRRIEPSGRRSRPVTIASIEDSRTSGYPRMARYRDDLVFAWIERNATLQVKTAIARLPK